MPTIDSHAHIWGDGFVPAAFFRHAAEEWATKAAERTPEMILPRLLDGIVDPTGDAFVADMDAAGFDATMVMMIDVGAPVFGEEPASGIDAQVEFYRALQRRHPGRLHCHVSVDHRRPGCLDAIRRAVREHGLVGIGEITPPGVSVADEALRPMMRLAADLGVPVQIHTRAGVWTDMGGSDFTEGNCVHPAHVARLARALPELRIVLCHAGFPHWWQVAAEAIAELPNCVLDISNWNEGFFREDEAGMVGRLATWRSLVGIERILFASDRASGPRFAGARCHLGGWAGFVRDLPAIGARWGTRFGEADVAAIMGGNAARFYQLQEEPLHADA